MGITLWRAGIMSFKRCREGYGEIFIVQIKSPNLLTRAFLNLERETRLELATPTLARLCSTN